MLALTTDHEPPGTSKMNELRHIILNVYGEHARALRCTVLQIV